MSVPTQQASSVRAFVQRHAVLVFYVAVFASLGLTLLVAGTDAFSTEIGSESEADASTYLVLAQGNVGFALIAVLVIAAAWGRAGLRDLRVRLLRWRVGAGWYAVALLSAPLLITAVLSALSLGSSDFRPAVLTSDDKAALVVAGLVIGLWAAVFEEVGWTGLATHELQKRHSTVVTGLLVGLPWAVLHWSIVGGTDEGTVPPVLYAVVAMFAWSVPYRVLMAWVYRHTRSVLVAILMHVALVASVFVLLSSSDMVGTTDLVANLAIGAMLWLVVAAVTGTDHPRES